MIRYLDESDAGFIFELLNTDTWLTFIGDRGIKSLEDARQYLINGPIASYKQHGFGLYKLSLREGTPIGMCGIIRRAGLDCPDLGFAVHPRYMGMGYSTEAASAIVDYARDILKIPQLAGITTPQNNASINVLRKVMFTHTGEVNLPGIQQRYMLFLRDLKN